MFQSLLVSTHLTIEHSLSLARKELKLLGWATQNHKGVGSSSPRSLILLRVAFRKWFPFPTIRVVSHFLSPLKSKFIMKHLYYLIGILELKKFKNKDKYRSFFIYYKISIITEKSNQICVANAAKILIFIWRISPNSQSIFWTVFYVLKFKLLTKFRKKCR